MHSHWGTGAALDDNVCLVVSPSHLGQTDRVCWRLCLLQGCLCLLQGCLCLYKGASAYYRGASRNPVLVRLAFLPKKLLLLLP